MSCPSQGKKKIHIFLSMTINAGDSHTVPATAAAKHKRNGRIPSHVDHNPSGSNSSGNLGIG